MPSAMAIMSFHPFDQAVLNSFLLIKGVVLVAQFNLMWGKPYPLQDSFTFSSTFSADVLPEKDSIPLIHCNGDKRQDMCNSELMLPLTMPSKTATLLAMLHMIRTQAHMLTHSALAVTEGPCHLQPPQTCSGQHPSHLHTPTDMYKGGRSGIRRHLPSIHTQEHMHTPFRYAQKHASRHSACMSAHVMWVIEHIIIGMVLLILH